MSDVPAAADVVVIGGGVIGACCAYELARDGAQVTVLERGAGWGEGASWGNAGLIVPSHARPIAAPENLRAGIRWLVRPDSPFGLRPSPSALPWLTRFALAATTRRAAAGEALQRDLAVESLERLRVLSAAGVDTGMVEAGVLGVHVGPHAAEEAAAEAGSETGRALGARVLTGAEARVVEPALARVDAAVLFPREAHCQPARLVGAIGAAALSSGATLHTGVDVLALGRDRGGIRIQTSTGTVQAERVVLAAGAWSGRLARPLGIPLPLQGGKGYAVEFRRSDIPIDRPLYLHEHRCVATPMGDRVRITGGLILEGLDESHDPRRVTAIRRAAAEMLGAGDATPLRIWRGLRPCTPDGLPVIGTHPAAPGLVLATGHGMLGVTLGAVTGRMVSGVVAGGPEHPALARLGPERFAHPWSRAGRSLSRA